MKIKIFFLLVAILLKFPNSYALSSIKLAKVKCVETKKIKSKKSSKSIDPKFITKRKIKKQQKVIRSLALKNKISKKTANLAYKMNFIPQVSRLERHQPERILTFDEYFTKVMPSYKIEDAKQFLFDNWDSLNKIEKTYKVDKEIIVSLILIETDLGKVLGNFNIVDSLFTLSVNSGRPKFWRKELLNVLHLIDKGKTIYARDIKGSWAGAVGMVQFLPSSFVNFAIDGDKDNFIGIIDNKADAFASAANYLSKSGWQYNQKYLKKTKVNFSKEALCKKAGFPFEDGFLVVPDKTPQSQAFIVQKNFNVILKWNRSLFFSTTVGLVYNELKNETKNKP